MGHCLLRRPWLGYIELNCAGNRAKKGLNRAAFRASKSQIRVSPSTVGRVSGKTDGP